jgi:succinate dehydrogenase flavin-adding protein (antitoxin of CptAB toxin-antitoxin module)
MNKNTMLKRVNDFIGTERSSKAQLSALSRDLLTYVYESNDSPMINRLIEGLTPANKRVACQFFPNFLAWEWDKETQQFTKKKKAKIVDSVLAKLEEALKNPAWDMWSWYEAKGVQPEKKDKDHKKAVGNAIKAALTEEGDNRLSITDIATLMFANGVDMRILMQAAESYAKIQEMEK